MIVLGIDEAMLPTKKIRCELKKCGKCHIQPKHQSTRMTAFTILAGRIANCVGEQSAILVNGSDKIGPKIIMALK